MMKKLMMFATLLSFLFAGTAHAAAQEYQLTGNLVSFTIYSPSGVAQLNPQALSLDPAQPFTLGTALMFSTTPGSAASVSVTLNPYYHEMQLAFFIGNVTYAGLEQFMLLNGTLASSGDHVTATGSARTTWGVGSWCTADHVATCSDLWSENRNLPGSSSTLDFLFTDTTLQQLNGTIVVNSKLNSSGWIERVYSVDGVAVPVPASAMLFGSAVLALAGARRRRTA
jgi:hypothetical protein